MRDTKNTRNEGVVGDVVSWPKKVPDRDYRYFSVRCPSLQTKKYEEEIRNYGVEAWSPMTWVHKRLPRRRARVWVLTPVAPSFIFVPLSQSLLFWSLPWPYGTHMHVFASGTGEIIKFSETDLRGLREHDNRDVEQRGVLDNPEKFEVGDLVEIDGTKMDPLLFGDKQGRVLKVDRVRETYSVAFENSPIEMWVSGFLLVRAAV